MRRLCCCVMLLLLTFSMFGCVNSQETILEPINFYYCNHASSFDPEVPAIASETREGSDYSRDLSNILSVYLQGPETSSLYSPFPTGTRLENWEDSNGTLRLIFSSELAQLTGVDLTLASVCLSKTIMEQFPYSAVEISAENHAVDGKAFIRIEQESVLLTDDSVMP